MARRSSVETMRLQPANTSHRTVRIVSLLLIAVAVVIAAIATACGGSSSTPTATSEAAGLETSTPGSTPTPEPTAQAFINNALLDVPDMPSGWQNAFAAASSLNLTLNLCNKHIDVSGYLAFGQTALSSGQNALLEHIAVYPADRAATVMNNTRSAFSSCTQWTATRSGQTLTFHAAPLQFPTLGDETIAYTLSATGPGNAPAGSQVYVAVRQGATVMTMSYLTTGTIDPATTQNLVRNAYAKVEKAQAPT